MSRLETIEEGISLTEKRLKNIPDFDIYKSILKQLHYLQMILNGSEPDRSKLSQWGQILTSHIYFHYVEFRKQKTENRKQKTENRKQKTENRKQKTENNKDTHFN